MLKIRRVMAINPLLILRRGFFIFINTIIRR